MSADRLMSWLWFIVAALYVLRVAVELATGQGALADTVPMLTAPALMKLYDMDGDDDA